MTAPVGTGRDAGRRKGRKAITRRAEERADYLGTEVRFLRSTGMPDERIAARLRVSAGNLGTYAARPEPAEAPEPADDGYDARWEACEGDRRAVEAMPLAADLIRCVAMGDAEGVRVLLGKVTEPQDWYSLAVVLAGCADPAQAAVVTGRGRMRAA